MGTFGVSIKIHTSRSNFKNFRAGELYFVYMRETSCFQLLYFVRNTVIWPIKKLQKMYPVFFLIFDWSIYFKLSVKLLYLKIAMRRYCSEHFKIWMIWILQIFNFFTKYSFLNFPEISRDKAILSAISLFYRLIPSSFILVPSERQWVTQEIGV